MFLGSANDHCVYWEALRGNLTTANGQYHFAGAGDTPSRGTLTVYKGVCYHLREHERGTSGTESDVRVN